MNDLIGTSIKGYEIRDRVGAGGFGAVYRAYQSVIEREVAIKIILPEHANQPEFIRGFEAEAQIVARLEHPYIIPLFDYWRDPQGAYLVMRFLRGGSLSKRLSQGPTTPDETVRIIEQVSSALYTAHRNNIVHRDLKPDNILLDEEGNAYLTDFGIAKLVGKDTTSENISGSLRYMAPEQLSAEAVSITADIYSLGLMIYEMMTGTYPFGELSPTQIVMKHLQDPIPDISDHLPDLPTEVNDILQKATAKNPEDRYTDARQVASDLRNAINRTQIVVDYQELDFENIANPYKGLRAFQEADAADFFGRDILVGQLLNRIEEQHTYNRFLAVVGPSGSGKSSVVRAGVVPALRNGALEGSDKWFIVDMVPGSQPLRQLEAALLSVALRPPSRLFEMLKADDGGLVWAVDRVLADVDGDLLLIIDQFEEVFTSVEDETERVHFLNLLKTAIVEPDSRLRVIITLRADFTDRPLEYVEFGELMRQRTEFVLPLSAQEIEQAITGPANRVGLQAQTELVAAIVSDVREEPGALPLLQYALTEVFERRDANRLTLSAYKGSGGVLGALARRAEEVYVDLDDTQQRITRQMFLRLITLGEGTEDTRRRARRSEIADVVKDNTNLQYVLDRYGQYRLLTFDFEPGTREPTLEVAHEALIREWQRLRGWLDNSRADVRLQRVLSGETNEWEKSNRDSSFLLSGARLTSYEEWAQTTDLALTDRERAYIDASIEERGRKNLAEAARKKREEETAARAEQFAKRAQQLRRAATILGVVGVLAVIAVIVAVLQVSNTQVEVSAGQTQIAGVEPTLADAQLKIDGANTQIAGVQPTLANAQAQIDGAQTQVAGVQPTVTAAQAQIDGAQTQIAGVQPTLDAGQTEIAGVEPTLQLANQRVDLAETQVAAVQPTLEAGQTQVAGVEPTLQEANNKVFLAETQVAGVQPTVQAAQAQIDAIVPTLQEAETKVAGVQPTLDSANQRVDEAATQVAAVQPTVTAAQLQLNSAQTQIAGVQPTLAAGQTQVAGVQPTLDAANAKADVAQAQVNIASTQVAGVQPTLDAAQAQIDAIVPTLQEAETKVAGVQPTLDAADTSVAAVQPTLTAAQVQIDGVQPTLSSAETQIAGVAPTLVAVQQEVQSQRQIADALRLVRSGQQLLEAGNPDLAIALVLEAYRLNPSLGETQRILNSAIPLTVRLNLTGSVGANYFSTTNRHVRQVEDRDADLFDPDRFIAVDRNGYQLFSDDERFLAVAVGNVVEIWSPTTRTLLNTLQANGTISTMVFSPDGQRIVAGTTQGAIYVWDAGTGVEQHILQGHNRPVLALAYSPSEAKLMSGGDDHRAILWDIDEGTEIQRLEDHLSPVLVVSFNANGSESYSYALDSKTPQVGVFRLGQTPAFRNSTAIYRAISPNGEIAVTGGQRNEFVALYDADSGVQQRTFQRGNSSTDYVRNIAFSNDGRKMLVHVEARAYAPDQSYVVIDRRVELWSIETGELLGKLDYKQVDPTSWDVYSLTFSADDTRALVGVRLSLTYGVTLWDLNTFTQIRQFKGHEAPPVQVAFSKLGTFALSASTDGNVRVWDIGTGELNVVKRIETNVQSMNAFGVSGDSTQAYISFDGQSMGTYNLIDGTEDRNKRFFTGSQLRVVFNPALPNVMVTTTDGMVLWDLTTGTRLHNFDASAQNISAIAYSADGKKVYFAESGTVYVYDIENDIQVPVLSATVSALAVSPNGEYLAMVSGKKVMVYDLVGNTTIMEFAYDGGKINSVAYSPDGGRLISAISEPDNSAIVLDINSGTQLFTLIGHRADVTSAIFSPDGLQALTGSVDDTLILWDMSSGQAIRQYIGHTAPVRQIIFSPIDSTAYSISDSPKDGIIGWAVESAQETVNWTYNNRYIQEINCSQRSQYGVDPQCENGVIPTPQPTPTAQATATSTATPTPRPTLTPTPTAIPLGTIKTDGSLANVRTGAGPGFSLVGQVANGTVVQVLEVLNDIGWARIRTPDGIEGWTLLDVIDR